MAVSIDPVEWYSVVCQSQIMAKVCLAGWMDDLAFG